MKNSKFRVWDEQNKIMHHNFKFISDKQKLTDKSHPLIVMEDVGINDIFEGDIVDFGGLGVVKYDGDRFYVDSGNVHTRVSNHHKVGNIYENAEFLQDDKENML